MSDFNDFLGSRDAVASFLLFGHVMECPAAPSSLPRWERCIDPRETVRDLLARADKELESAFGEIERDRVHVVPLSGGLDSRLLLIKLIESGVPVHNIRTATYGIPGALDYDYGRLVARSLGVRHFAIDARQLAPRVEDLEAVAEIRPNAGWLIGAHYNRVIRSRFGPDVVYWSGVAAGPVTDLPRLPSDRRPTTWADWTRTYCDLFAVEPPAPLTADGWDPRTSLPDAPLATTAQAEPWDQLLVDVRTRYGILPEHLEAGYDVRLPQMAEGWVAMWLSVHPDLRRAQRLYRKMVADASTPALRRIPVKGYAPPTRWSGPQALAARVRARLTRRAGINYLDLSHELRDDSSRFGATIKSLVQRVQETGVAPWVDTERLWAAHHRGTEDHGLGLTHVASLGAYIRT